MGPGGGWFWPGVGRVIGGVLVHDWYLTCWLGDSRHGALMLLALVFENAHLEIDAEQLIPLALGLASLGH